MIQSSPVNPDPVYPDIHYPDKKHREQTCSSNNNRKKWFDNPDLASRLRTEYSTEIRINELHIPLVLHFRSTHSFECTVNF